VVLYAAMITWISGLPNLAPPGDTPDWIMHIAEYAGLTALAVRAVEPDRMEGWGVPLLAAAACLAFAAGDEVHQSFVPGRTASLRDWLFDAVGIALGGSLMLGWYARAKRAPEDRGRTGAAHPAGSVRVVLLGRPACHLCDEAEQVMRPVLEQLGVAWTKLDVDRDEALAMQYGEEIPVVLIDGRKAFKHRVDPARLRRKLGSRDRRRE
jgi:VanZ family protein